MSKMSKAKQRQSSRNKGYYKTQYYKTAKNKIKKIKRAIRLNPNDKRQASRLAVWESFYAKPLVATK